jgi:hypothetical protein
MSAQHCAQHPKNLIERIEAMSPVARMAALAVCVLAVLGVAGVWTLGVGAKSVKTVPHMVDETVHDDLAGASVPLPPVAPKRATSQRARGNAADRPRTGASTAHAARKRNVLSRQARQARPVVDRVMPIADPWTFGAQEVYFPFAAPSQLNGGPAAATAPHGKARHATPPRMERRAWSAPERATATAGPWFAVAPQEASSPFPTSAKPRTVRATKWTAQRGKRHAWSRQAHRRTGHAVHRVTQTAQPWLAVAPHRVSYPVATSFPGDHRRVSTAHAARKRHVALRQDATSRHGATTRQAQHATRAVSRPVAPPAEPPLMLHAPEGYFPLTTATRSNDAPAAWTAQPGKKRHAASGKVPHGKKHAGAGHVVPKPAPSYAVAQVGSFPVPTSTLHTPSIE